MISKRFTIKRLMLVIAGFAGLLALFQQGLLIAMNVLYALGLAGLAWLPSRGRPRLALWGFVASVAWLNLSILTIMVYLPSFNNDILAYMASLAFVPIAPGFGLAWVTSLPGRARRVRSAVVVVGLMALAISMLATAWPFRLAFYLSSPALNRLADRVDSGGKVVPGEWAGFYRIRGSIPVRYDGATMLIVNDDPRWIAGFARRKGARLGVVDREGLHMGIGVAERWAYVAED